MHKAEKKQARPSEKKDKPKEAKARKEEELEEDEFDFGGLPKNVPFKRNIGCGG